MFKFVVLAALVALVAANPTPRPRLDGRIVGGQDADISDYPHQLSLQSYGSHICGASIILPNIAVTAAHCTYGSSASSLSVVAGITNINEGGQVLQVREIHQHPKFSMSTIDYDISVLELEHSIELGPNAKPINLASQGTDPSDGTDVTCTGWGATSEGGWGADTLQAVNIQIVGRETCNDQYDGSITDRMICAGVNGGGKDACQGDSGGPLIARDYARDNRDTLVGIVSWGYGCARPDYAGVYTNVGALRDFISECVESGF